jgi:signal peptidase I
VTDDPELRARIEAQVAARRARRASPTRPPRETDAPAEDDLGDEAATPTRALAPARPWERPGDETDPPATDAGDEGTESVAGGAGLPSPARPWLERERKADQSEPERATHEREDDDAEPAAEPEPPAGTGSLRPDRPWSTHSSSREPSKPSAPTPSNPDIVLRELAAELTPVEQTRLDRLRDLPGDPDGPAADEGADDEMREANRTGDETATGELGGAGPYPWQRQEEVDLDLYGAPTWDPSMYPPEPDAPAQPARRALRWLFARSPRSEPAGAEPSAPAANEPEPAATHEPEPAAAYEPYAAAPTTVFQPLPEPDPEGDPEPQPEPATDPGDDLAAEPPPAGGGGQRRSGRSGLFGRRRHVEDGPEPDEENYPEFDLPAPDAAFEQPWLRSDATPRPTRDWARAAERSTTFLPAEPEPEFRPAPISPDEELDLGPDLDLDLEPAPLTAPSAAGPPEPEAAPEPEPEPAPAPEPAELGASPRRRPSPGPRAAAAAAASAAAAANATAATSRPRPRPRPAATGAVHGARPSAAPAAPARGARTADEPEDPEPVDDDDDDDDDHQPRRRGRGRLWRWIGRLAVIVVIAGGLAILLRVWVVQPYYVPSESMEPTLHGCSGCTNDRVLVEKVSYRAHGVRAQDIVVFTRPKGLQVPDKVLIKRVIALAGDRVAAKKGQIYVNGLPITEPYLNRDKSCYARSPDENFGPRTVPNRSIFVMGDNRCNSTDSRDFGAVPTSSVVGRAFLIFWPLTRIEGL